MRQLLLSPQFKSVITDRDAELSYIRGVIPGAQVVEIGRALRVVQYPAAYTTSMAQVEDPVALRNIFYQIKDRFGSPHSESAKMPLVVSLSHTILGIFQIEVPYQRRFYLAVVEEDLGGADGDLEVAWRIIKYDSRGSEVEHIREPGKNDIKYLLKSGDPKRWLMDDAH